MKPAIVVDCPGGLERDPFSGIRRQHDVPPPVASGSSVCNDIGIHPIDCIADVGRDLLRRIRDLLTWTTSARADAREASMGIVFKSDACDVLLEWKSSFTERSSRERRGLPAARTQAVYSWRSQVAGWNGRVSSCAPAAPAEWRRLSRLRPEGGVTGHPTKSLSAARCASFRSCPAETPPSQLTSRSGSGCSFGITYGGLNG